MKTLPYTVFSFASTFFLPYCFSVLFAFLSSKLSYNNLMHCEMTDCCFNVFFVEIQLKKKKTVYRSPKEPEYVLNKFA